MKSTKTNTGKRLDITSQDKAQKAVFDNLQNGFFLQKNPLRESLKQIQAI